MKTMACQTTPDKFHKRKPAVGCISGIFNFLSKYHTRRKFLTFGKKQQQAKSDHANLKPNDLTQGHKNTNSRTQIQCELKRSPTIPAAIRRQENSKSGTEYLNGIESTAEKRRRLLGALQRCDEDLRDLRRLIEAIHKAESSPSPSPSPALKKKKCDETQGEGAIMTNEEEIILGRGGGKLRTDRLNLDDFTCLNARELGGQAKMQQQQQRRKMPGEDEFINLCLLNRIMSTTLLRRSKKIAKPLWNSKAMIESVDEVSKSIAWGEKREVGRIGLVLQDFIYRDLLEEILKDMGCITCVYPLPHDACKRSLRF